MLFDTKATKAIFEDLRQSTKISRRNLLRSATIIASGATVLATTITATHAEADSGKMTQAAAAYQTSPKSGQRCDGCAFFKAPSSCQLVDGTISPAGWCKFYAKKS
jgi:hypothetical protein